MIAGFRDGYYWARHDDDGSTFVVLLEDNDWYVHGVARPIRQFRTCQVICPIPRPAN